MFREQTNSFARLLTKRPFAAGACALALALAAAAFATDAAHAQGLLWFEHDRPAVQAQQAVDLLLDAGAEGLEPADYGADQLRTALAAAADDSPDADVRRRLDADLTRAMQRFLHDLHQGRADPHRMHAEYRLTRDRFDAASILRAALAAQRLPDAVREVAPRMTLYADLRQHLARYRALGDPSAWRTALPPLPDGKVEPGQAYAGLALVAQRLRLLGDLAPEATLPAIYEGNLVEAVRTFQRRHGLADDGVIGRATRAELDVPPAQRVQQITLTMERLRWTPWPGGARLIVVNVPEFALHAYDARGQEHLRMKAIVGRAVESRTPLINEDMRYIEFSPYWNVPASIARDEIIPRVRREPGYFEREGFELVGPYGDTSAIPHDDLLEAVLRGQWRLRQRPGPKNALGDIKFVFPNNESIFLHHTPSPRLFDRQRRDFSHGCIRVDDPVSLALFALQDQPEWNEARVRESMTLGSARILRLATPLPVLVAYATAVVQDGRPYFFPDLYGYDRELARELREGHASRVIRPTAAPAR